MEHVVFFPSPDGTPAFRRVPSLEEAVRLVEHLRNVEGVNEVSCHALTEVPLAFRAYYRVEVPAGEAPAVPAQAMASPVEAPVEMVQVQPEPELPAEVPAATPVAVEAPAVESVPVEPEPAMASSNGHAADGAKSLGFFA